MFAGLSPAPSPLVSDCRGWQQPHASDSAWHQSRSALAGVSWKELTRLLSLTFPYSHHTYVTTGSIREWVGWGRPSHGTLCTQTGHGPPPASIPQTLSAISKRPVPMLSLFKMLSVYAQFFDTPAPARCPLPTPKPSPAEQRAFPRGRKTASSQMRGSLYSNEQTCLASLPATQFLASFIFFFTVSSICHNVQLNNLF